MKFVLDSSLKKQALAAVAINLWNHPDARLFFTDVFLSFDENDDYSLYWAETKGTIQFHASKLMILDSLKEDLSYVVDAVGCEMLQWCSFHVRYCVIMKRIPSNFCWTPYGTIDSLKTADLLVHDETTDLIDRFQLACFYCFEEYILELWFQLDEAGRHEISSPFANGYLSELIHRICEENYVFRIPFSFLPDSLIGYWCSYIERKLPLTYHSGIPFITTCHGLQHAINASNEVAVKYFLPKVTEDEKNRILDIVLPSEFRNTKLLSKITFKDYMNAFKAQPARLLLFFLNSMDEMQQLKMLKQFPMEALHLFLEWPLQEHFMALYHYIGHFLSDEQFYCVLELILYKRNMGHRDCDYHQLFIQLWLEASVDNRKYILGRHSKISSLLLSLSKLNDRSTFNVIFKDVPSEQKEQLLFEAFNLISDD